MLIAPRKGFVFLAMPKTGTTAVERAFRPYSDGSFLRNPFKHLRYDDFQGFVEPLLDAKGYPRDSYEVVCVCREPIDWLFSWWRYRSRQELADRPGGPHPHYAGHVTFEQFARAYLRRQRRRKVTRDTRFANVGRPTRFLQPLPERPDIDRLFRYERIDLLVDYLRGKVGRRVAVEVRNTSPQRSFALSTECEQELRRFFEPDYRLYERAIAVGAASPAQPGSQIK